MEHIQALIMIMWSSHVLAFSSLQMMIPIGVVIIAVAYISIRGLVLVRGDVSVPKLTRPEGLHLIQLLRAFYIEQPDMVDCFNNRPAEFDVMAHLSSCPQLDQSKTDKKEE